MNYSFHSRRLLLTEHIINLRVIKKKEKNKKKNTTHKREEKKSPSVSNDNDYTSFQSFSNFAGVTMTKWKHLPIQLYTNAHPLDY